MFTDRHGIYEQLIKELVHVGASVYEFTYVRENEILTVEFKIVSIIGDNVILRSKLGEMRLTTKLGAVKDYFTNEHQLDIRIMYAFNKGGLGRVKVRRCRY